MSPYIDCHNHLQDKAFDPDRQDTIALALEHRIQYSVVNGTHPHDWIKIDKLAQQYEHVIPCFGLHPWFINAIQGSAWQLQLRNLLEKSPSGVGEFGLDLWKKGASLELQIPVFRFQWTLAADLDRPAIIHCLKAWGPFMKEIKEVSNRPRRFMIHGFGGPTDLIAPLVRAGAYFSVAGNILESDRTKAHQVLRAIPLNRLLIETDAPDMCPPPTFCRDTTSKPKRNEPANLPTILTGLAALRPESEETLIQAVYTNSQRFLEGLIP